MTVCLGLSGAAADAESRRLRDAAAASQSDMRRRGMAAARRKLPAFSQREEVLHAVKAHPALVVSGATGVFFTVERVLC